jgi:hypothetical protein
MYAVFVFFLLRPKATAYLHILPMSQTTKNIFGRSTLALSAFFFYVVNLAAVLLIGVNSPRLTVADK